MFSFKVLNTQNKKYYIPITVFSILLLFTFNLSIFFILLNYVALFSFYTRKKKSAFTAFLVFLGVLVLCLPTVPFILNAINVPDYLKNYSIPFNINHVIMYFINSFSPKLSVGSFFDFSNIGFWLFVLIPSLIGFVFAIKGAFLNRVVSLYCASLFVSVFLSMLILCICENKVFLSKYLITVYPMLMALASGGISSLKDKTPRVIVPTIYATFTLFYIVVRNFFPTNLF